ncbi:1156_t:CDS:2 [Funneliformis mosseae]|uniref:1156_t:CDS:1 n=1 Tax=Funneliformis mosseae TaxID=27381 RepID=A0A9N9FIQ9_FUNMO|nr:1156_t:CDS:2 [Funneliformis mosseae]
MVDSGHYLDTTANSGQIPEFFFHRAQDMIKYCSLVLYSNWLNNPHSLSWTSPFLNMIGQQCGTVVV